MDTAEQALLSDQISLYLQIIALGAVLGATGQVLRVSAGLKKLSDETSGSPDITIADLFSTGRLIVSLLIGAVAGLVSALTVLDMDEGASLTRETVLAIIAAGYAGTDFIEAFIGKYLPKAEAPVASSTDPATATVENAPAPSGSSSGRSEQPDGSVG